MHQGTPSNIHTVYMNPYNTVQNILTKTHRPNEAPVYMNQYYGTSTYMNQHYGTPTYMNQHY